MKEATEELKKKVESILFASGKKIELAEIANLCRLSHNLKLVEKILNELKKKYDKESSSLMLVRHDTAWKLTVREKYVSLIKNLVTKTELSKTIMETLAIIAYKAPVLQSDIIKIRTNKAYDHLRELERTGYVTRKKKGRTKLIELTTKFFEYFDVPPEKLKEKFKTVEELEKAVEIKEAELKEAKTEEKEKKAVTRKEQEKKKKSTEGEIKKLDKILEEKEEKLPEVDLIDKEGHEEKLETYDSEVAEGTEFEEPKSNIQVVTPKVEGFDVVSLGMTDEQKQHLIEQAARLRREDEGFLKKKGERAAAAEREKKFEKKFKIVGAGEEKPPEEEEKEEVEEAPEEEIPEEKPAEVGAEKPEVAEEEKPEEAPAEAPKPAIPELKTKAEKPKEERVSVGGVTAEAAEHRKAHPKEAKGGKRLFEKGVPKDVQEKIDTRVEEIVFGKKKEEKEEPKKKEEKGKTPERY